MNLQGAAGDWAFVDDWWESWIGTRSSTLSARSTSVLDQSWADGLWESLDPWWSTYVDNQQAALRELLEVLEETQGVWERSGGTHNADPLAADWRTDPLQTGPLRVNQEENWSQWLAHLLRSAPPSMLAELFGTDSLGKVASVRREAHLRDPDATDRYADILVFFDDVGVSIEVKKGDEHYEKTEHTASLVESRYRNLDWTHVLLVPDHKLPRVRRSFDEQFEEPPDRRPVIRSDEAGDIAVLYWRDISRTVRRVLQDNTDVGPHWGSSAYVLCTLIEQKILQFAPIPVVNRLVDANDVVGISDSIVLSGTDIADQISYLRSIMESKTDE